MFPYSRVVVHFVACCGYNVDRWSFAPKDGVSRQKTRPNVLLPNFLTAHLSDTDNSIVLFTVNGKSIGRAMYELELQLGSEWSGFTPDIDKPTDTPLETAIKAVIKRMIQIRPADRMNMGEVVSKFAELRSQYKPDAESKDKTPTENITPSESKGNEFICGTRGENMLHLIWKVLCADVTLKM